MCGGSKRRESFGDSAFLDGHFQFVFCRLVVNVRNDVAEVDGQAEISSTLYQPPIYSLAIMGTMDYKMRPR